jgi:hypothetical protein
LFGFLCLYCLCCKLQLQPLLLLVAGCADIIVFVDVGAGAGECRISSVWPSTSNFPIPKSQQAEAQTAALATLSQAASGFFLLKVS